MNNNNNVCVAYHQGDRKYMEDTLDVQTFMIDGKKVKIYAVFDGHGGAEVSKQLANQQTGLITFLSKKLQLWAIRKSENLELVLKETFVEYDKYLLDKGFRKSGSTATVALHWDNRLYLINAGDSRGMVFIPSTGEVVAVTQDHKPDRVGEAKRIREAGGQVTKVGNHPKQPSRVNGILSVSRGFGDFYLKLQKNKNSGQVVYPGAFSKVSPVPDIITIQMDLLKKKVGQSSVYILLGSDGLWDHYDGLNPEGLKNLYRFGDQNWCQMLMNFVFISGKQQKAELDNITFLIDKVL
jgi:serine/threonine protein phosphatase PrpC